MEMLLQSMPATAILILALLVGIGEVLKKYTVLANKFLPVVLPILGCIINGSIYMVDAEVFTATEFAKQAIWGIIIGWGATGGYETFKNIFLKQDNLIKVIEMKDKVGQLTEEADNSVSEDKSEGIEEVGEVK